VDAFGGGIFNAGTLTVAPVDFRPQPGHWRGRHSSTIGSSALGGAIMSSGTGSAPATATATSTFLDNQAIGGAAGIGASRAAWGAHQQLLGTFTVSNSVFHDNQAVGGLEQRHPGGFGAGVGGAISNVARFGNAFLSVTHSTLTNNRAVGGAAGAGTIGAKRPGRRDRELTFSGESPLP
jgi:hypothetical protein